MAIPMYVQTCNSFTGLCKYSRFAVAAQLKNNMAGLFTAVSATLMCVRVERFSHLVTTCSKC